MLLEERLSDFAEKNRLQVVKQISKGYSSRIFLVKNSSGKEFALKIEKEKSRRVEMAEKEASNLQKANFAGVGPRLCSFDSENRCILMEFIEGRTFSEWLFSNPSKKGLEEFLEQLFEQATNLDSVGLSHGQLAGKGKNILVRKGKPVIIDFEKASQNRRARNVYQLLSFLFLNKHSAIAKKINEIVC